MAEPTSRDLTRALDALSAWAVENAPGQLHPGDIGWHCRFGHGETAASVTTWDSRGAVAAVALADSPTLLRLAFDPRLTRDASLAERVVADVTSGSWNAVEAPAGTLVRELLIEAGWTPGEDWLPLSRGLAGPVEEPPLRIETVGPELAAARVAVQRAAFTNSTFTAGKWRDMASGPAYATGRCLLAFDTAGDPVAAATVWSAGAGRVGLLEPLGVHRDHRGRGYGAAIAVAAAGALRDMGASSALVFTPTSNAAAVATYARAGFRAGEAVPDLRRPVGSDKGPHAAA